MLSSPGLTRSWKWNGGPWISLLGSSVSPFIRPLHSEEQHGDQILHELLRCFKALSTSSTGCFALRSSCPTPYVQLISLLYSDKKPGDVATRQLMVELLMIVFDLYPSSSLPSTGGRLRHEAWESNPVSNVITFPSPHKNLFSLIRALLLTPAPPPAESPAVAVSPHAFIESLHRPRIYKSYLQELSDVCRDYFWVFCHPNNTIWNLVDVDEGKVEKPKAPGGMTGGVEFEAMGYLVRTSRDQRGTARLRPVRRPRTSGLSMRSPRSCTSWVKRRTTNSLPIASIRISLRLGSNASFWYVSRWCT